MYLPVSTLPDRASVSPYQSLYFIETEALFTGNRGSV
ncbi:hypothetical protein BACCAC_03851 [Bacteroides caccae ATCC 43185]|nr:hypothetical protein BACCAC_03851 [Bacteroides caccae ATCC 43185]